MTKPPLIGALAPAQLPEKAPPKPKPESIKIVNISSCPTFTPLGQPAIAVFGLGDNAQVYIWNMQTRTWMDN